MYINQRKINEENSPYIIAELSANHGGDLKRAKKSIENAAKSGVSAVKIQTYTPDTMTIDSQLGDFVVSNGLWKGRTLYELYSEAYTPFEWHEELFRHADQCGVTLFSTPFDESAVEFFQRFEYKLHLLKTRASMILGLQEQFQGQEGEFERILIERRLFYRGERKDRKNTIKIKKKF